MRYLLIVLLVVLASVLSSYAADEKKAWQDWSEMRSAAKFCDKEKMRKLLADGANIETVNPQTGQTLLMDAAARNNPDAVKFLLSFGAGINAKDEYGQTAFCHSLASVSRGWTAAKVLFDAGAEINTVTSDGSTELTAAVINQNVDGVTFLLSCYKKKKIKRADNREKTMQQALFHYNPKIFKLLAEWDLAASKDPKTTATAILRDAVEYKNAAPAVKWLIARGADAGVGILLPACSNGNIDAAKALVKAGANVNARDPEGKTALMCAAENGASDVGRQKLEIVNGLVKSGADVNARDNEDKTALMYAATWSLPIVRSLLLSGAKVYLADQGGDTALFYAAGLGDIEMVKLLLSAGADAKARDKHGATVLHWAADNWKIELMKLLIGAGADIKLKDEYGNTVFMKAVCRYSAKPEYLKFLIDAGADPVACNNKGRTALMKFAAFDSLPAEENIKQLIAAGIDVNARDEKGKTALMEASVLKTFRKVNPDYLATFGKDKDSKVMIDKNVDKTGMIKLLLSAGADVNAADKEGRTALDYAEKNEAAIKILKEAGALHGQKNSNKKD